MKDSVKILLKWIGSFFGFILTVAAGVIGSNMAKAGVIKPGVFFLVFLCIIAIFLFIAIISKKKKKKVKDTSIETTKKTMSDTRWMFRIKFEDGTHQKKQVTLSEKDYKRICDIFDEEIPINGSTDLEGILQRVKKQLEEKLGRKITSIKFCDENYD